jgi:ABC-type oligopeptide transport system substrate-binding subunit
MSSMLAIIPKKAFLDMGAEAFGKKPVGSGPYRMVNWVKDDRME